MHLKQFHTYLEVHSEERLVLERASRLHSVSVKGKNLKLSIGTYLTTKYRHILVELLLCNTLNM